MINDERAYNNHDRKEAYERILNFQNLKGFKQCDDFKSMYKLNKQLGKGSFGSVWSAVHIKVKAPCAVKIVTKKKLKEMKVY